MAVPSWHFPYRVKSVRRENTLRSSFQTGDEQEGPKSPWTSLIRPGSLLSFSHFAQNIVKGPVKLNTGGGIRKGVSCGESRDLAGLVLRTIHNRGPLDEISGGQSGGRV